MIVITHLCTGSDNFIFSFYNFTVSKLCILYLWSWPHLWSNTLEIFVCTQLISIHLWICWYLYCIYIYSTNSHSKDHKILSRKFTFHWNLSKITGTLREDQCTFTIISGWILLRVRLRWNKNRHNTANICLSIHRQTCEATFNPTCLSRLLYKKGFLFVLLLTVVGVNGTWYTRVIKKRKNFCWWIVTFAWS